MKMRVTKRPFVFRFKNKKQITNFMCLNHSFPKIKIKMRSKIEVTVNNFFRS